MSNQLEASIRKAVREGTDIPDLAHMVKSIAIDEALFISFGNATAAASKLGVTRATISHHRTHDPVMIDGTKHYKPNLWYINRGEQPVEDYYVVQVEYSSGKLSKADFAHMFDWDKSSHIKRWKVIQ